MDKFEQKQMKKIRTIKNNCYDRLINYISEPIRKSVSCITLFQINTPKQKLYWQGKKLSEPKTHTKKEIFLY